MKNWLKITLGKILIFFQPKEAFQLAQNGMTLDIDHDLTLKDRLMRSAILSKAEKNKDFDKLAEFHHNFWIKKGIKHFSNCDDILQGFFLPNCGLVFEELQKLLKEQPGNFDTMVEIGTGNGDVLNYLSSKYLQINKFVGIDLSKDQIDINKRKYEKNSRLEFVCSDGLDWVIKYGKGNMIIFTSGGVLEYFTEQRVLKLFNEVHKLGKEIFIAIEPIGVNIDFNKNPSSRPYGHERSFSHNYAKLFKDAGFDIWHKSTIPYKDTHDFKAFIAKN